MALVITEDLVEEGPDLREEGITLTATRFLLVSNFDPDRSNPYGRFLEALQHPDVPPYGEVHPGGLGLFVIRRTATLKDGDPYKVVIRLDYGVPGTPVLPPPTNPPALLTVGAVIQPKRTTQYPDGSPLPTLYYPQYAADGKTQLKDKDGNLLWQSHIADIEVWVPSPLFTYTRTEVGSPGPNATKHVGHINEQDFAGEPPFRWRCNGITGVSRDAGVTYDVTYEFQLAGPGEDQQWDIEASWKGPDGLVPSDIKTEDQDPIHPGLVQIGWYPLSDFNELQL